MTQPYESNSNFILIKNRLIEVTKTMRSLADELENFANFSDTAYLNAISTKVAKNGWNSLFAASMIAKIFGKFTCRSEMSLDLQLQQLTEQIDDLQAAINYFEETICQIKELNGKLPFDQQEIFANKLKEMGIMLEEVCNACK